MHGLRAGKTPFLRRSTRRTNNPYRSQNPPAAGAAHLHLPSGSSSARTPSPPRALNLSEVVHPLSERDLPYAKGASSPSHGCDSQLLNTFAMPSSSSEPGITRESVHNDSSPLPLQKVARDLRNVILEMNARGLARSTQWCSELLCALETAGVATPTAGASSSAGTYAHMLSSGRVMLARSCLDMREFSRAAAMLRGDDSDLGVFLRLYATYLEGERARANLPLENAHSQGPGEALNKQLQNIRDELLQRRRKLNSDLDAYLQFLLGAVHKRLDEKDRAIEALSKAVEKEPMLWSAWWELTSLVESVDDTEVFAAITGHHWMSMLFTAHVQNESDELESARETYEAIVDQVPMWRYARAQLALVLYNMRLFAEAQIVYEDLFKDFPESLEGSDIFSNVLFVMEARTQLSALASRCSKVDKYCAETCCVLGNYFALRQNHDRAVLYFQRALRLNRDYLSAWTLMGHEYVEMKNTGAAVEAYRRAVDVNPKDFRAWYGLGQTYELLQLPTYALHYYKKAASLRPRDSRMWCAVGHALEEGGRLEDATRAYERAIRCEDPENIALLKLASLYENRAGAEHARGNATASEMKDKAAYYYSMHLQLMDDQQFNGNDVNVALKFLAQHAVEKKDFKRANLFLARLTENPVNENFVRQMRCLIPLHDVAQNRLREP